MIFLFINKYSITNYVDSITFDNSLNEKKKNDSITINRLQIGLPFRKLYLNFTPMTDSADHEMRTIRLRNNLIYKKLIYEQDDSDKELLIWVY